MSAKRILLIAVSCLLFGGFSVVSYLSPEDEPYDRDLASVYRKTVLGKSSSGDVFEAMSMSGRDEVSQSKSVIASYGEKKEGYELWYNMAAFNEDSMSVNRKYFFVIDERPKAFSVNPHRSMIFDSEIVLDDKILTEPYANDNSEQAAILKHVLKKVRVDTDEVSKDNKKIGVCGMIVNQTLETILRDLEASPVLASRLGTTEGLEFDHITLGKGFAKMNISGGKAVVDIRTGKHVDHYDEKPVAEKSKPSQVKQ